MDYFYQKDDYAVRQKSKMGQELFGNMQEEPGQQEKLYAVDDMVREMEKQKERKENPADLFDLKIPVYKGTQDDAELSQKSKMGQEHFEPVQKELEEEKGDQQKEKKKTGFSGDEMLELRREKKEKRSDPKVMTEIIQESNKEYFEKRAKRIELIAKPATEQLKKNFAGYMDREEKEVQIPNLSEMKASHKVQYRQRVIKRTLKKDKVVVEKVVEDKEGRTREKSAVAKLVSTAHTEITNEKVKARTELDINIKKNMDYHTFTQLSEFAPLLGKEQFKNLATLYGDATEYDRRYDEKDEKSKQTRKELRERSLFPAMDMLTDVIMKMEPGSFDVSSDRAIAKSARELEKMSAAVKSYRSLLEKNPDYFEALSSRKVDEEAFGDDTYADAVMRKLEQLSAIGNYYELRKLVIEDDLYTSLANEEISMEEEKGDDIKTKNLKKNMRLSYYAGIRLQKVFLGADIRPETFETKDNGAMELMGERRDSFDADLQMNKPTMSQAERHLEYLKKLGSQQKLVDRTVHEQLFIAPKEEYDLLTLDTKKMRTTPACGKFGALMFQNTGAAMTPRAMVLANGGNESLYDRFLALGVEKSSTKEKKSWGGTPHFIGGKDEYLSRLTISDTWSRLHLAFTSLYAYRRTDDEMMELADLLSIQSDEKAWEEIKRDPDKLAYYESAYKEMAMRNFEAMYAGMVRVAQTVGMKSILLHPVDLIQQATMELKKLFMASSIITNTTMGDNPELIKKLFAENDKDGRFTFDIEDFKNIGATFAALNFKLTSVGDLTASLYKKIKGSDRSSEYYLGYDAEKAMAKEHDALIKQLEKEGKHKEAEECRNRTEIEKVDWYISMHPEIYSVKNLLKKKNGKYIHQNAMISETGNMLSDGEMAFNKLVKSKRIELPTDEEVQQYQEYLKKNKYFALRRPNTDDDLEEINGDIERYQENEKSYADKLAKLKNEKASEEEIKKAEKEVKKMQDQIDDLEAMKKYMNQADQKAEDDPYALSMMKSGLEELKYKNRRGEEKIIRTIKAFREIRDEDGDDD